LHEACKQTADENFSLPHIPARLFGGPNGDGIQDLLRFMVLYALQRFDHHDCGRNKDFLPVQVDGKECHKFKIEDIDLGTVDLLFHTSHDERVTHYGSQGRATNVVPVTSESLTKKYPNIQDGMVAKIFWGEASCPSELKILEKVEQIAKEHESVRGHIPELLWHYTFTNPTSAVREALGVPGPTTGSRVLYILIFRKLRPITELHGKDLFNVWYQCILCTYFRHIYEAFVDMAYRPYYTVEERGPSSGCQPCKLDVVQERREADRRLERL
jgi:hypothetical protein